MNNVTRGRHPRTWDRFKRRKVSAWLTTLVLIVGLIPTFSIPAAFAEDVPTTEGSNAPETTLLSLESDPLVLTPTISSDKADYYPGELVTLTGTGWYADPTDPSLYPVTIDVAENNAGTFWTRTEQVVPTPSGSIVDSFNLPNYFVALYSVSATQLLPDGTSISATSSFTDANPPGIQQLWQCDPPAGFDPTTYTCVSSGSTGWVTGNNDGPLFEGDTIPYRTRFQDLVPGTTYSITIEWDTSKSGKHAIDYLNTFNATMTAADPCASLSGLPAGLCTTSSTLPIPVDSIMQSDPDWIANGGVQDSGQFTMFGGTLIDTGQYTLDRSVGADVTEPSTTCSAPGCYAGDTSTFITVTFEAAETDVVMAWGGHIGARDDWGQDNSAVFISGSPYHMRIKSWRDITNNKDLNVGNTDRSLSAQAVIFPASITIVKAATPEGSTSFPFTASPTPLTNFALVDDGTSTNTVLFGNITAFTTYTVAETAPTGWSLTGVVCSVTNANGGTQSVTGATTTISLKEGENVTCTYSNELTAVPTMTVEKSSTTSSLSAPGTVNYSYLVTNTGNVTLTGISLSDDNDNNDMSCPFTTLAPAGTMTCTATHTFSQAELDANGSPTADSGFLDNEVTASSNEAPDATDDLSIPITQNASMTVEKSSTTSSLSAPGTVNYSYLVTNTGNVTLTGISLSDDNDNNDMSCPFTTLAPAGTMTCTATHTFSQAELDANGSPTADSGFLDNEVTASSNEAPDATDDLSIPITQNAVIAVDKAAVDSDLDGLIWNDADLSGFPDAGETVDYDFTVTNDGNVTLFDVTLTDNDGVVIGALSGLTDEDDDAADDDLAVGASATATGTYTLTQSDIDAGSYENNVDADAVDPDGDPVTDDDTETVTLPKNAVIAVDKAAVDSDLDGLIWNDADLSGFPDAGETVDYDFTVTNDGNVTLFDVTLTDNDGVVIGALSGLTDEDGDAADDDLAVGASATATGTYTLTQSDIDAGSYENNVDADAVDPDGDPVTDDDTETVTLPKNAVIAVDKAAVDSDLDGLIWNDADLSGFPDAGETVDYDFTVTNDGNVTLFDVTLTDNDGVVIGALSGLTDEDGDAADDDLAVGASATATGTYTLTQSDIDAGSYENNVDADAVDPDGDPVTDDDTETVTLPKNAVIAVDKAAVDSDLDGLIWNDADLSGFPDAGETVDYDFTVTNDGNVTLFDVTLTDNDGVVIGALSGLTDEDGDAADDDLAVGASATATGTYTLTQSDIDAGSYENNVDADAVDPDGDPVTDDDTETVTLPKNAVIAVDKAAVDSDLDGLIWNDADLSGFPDAGETVDYDFTVTNDGNVTLFDVTLTDNDGVVIGALSGLTDEDGDAADDDLAVGASATATGTYTLTQSDIDAGSYENNVDADAVDPDGDPVTDDDTETVTLPKNAVIAVDKAAVDSDLDGLIWNDADLSGFPDAGETVDYDFTVTNDGNVTLFDVTLTDNDGVVIGALSGLTDEDGDAADDDLAVGASATATGTYTLTQSDIDAGSYENNVDADAVDPDGDPVTDDDTETVTLPKNAVIAVDKAAVDSDLDGLIWNDADLSGFPDAGETVDYDFTVTNDGNVTLFDVTLTDNDGVVIGALSGLTDEDGDAADDDLAVGASATATGTYTLTQSDIDAGSYENNVDADAVDPDGDPVTDDDTETVTLPKNAVIAVDKAAVDSDLDGLIWNDADLSGFPDAGETVDYDFTVTNDGNVTLFDVTLTDNDGVVIGALSGLTDEDGDAADDDLAVGASATATGTYTLTQSDIDAGSYENNVDADAVDPDGDPVTDDDTETVTLPKNAVIAVDKAAVDSDLDGLIWNDADLSGFPDAGETVDYDFTVTNDGNVTLFDVTLTDNDGVVIGALSGLTDEDGDAADDDLAVGASATATGTYTLTQSDIDAGSYENNVDADAVDPDGDPVTDDDTETVTLPKNAVIAVDKAAVDSDLDGLIWNDADLSGFPDAGETVDYDFTVTNDGNVTLFDVTLTDNDGVVIGALSGLTDEDGDAADDDLAVGASATATGTYTLTQSDIDAGSYENNVDADAVDPDGDPVTDDDTETVTLPKNAVIAVDKAAVDSDLDGLIWNDADLSGFPDAGETVDYDFTVTNDGNVTLFDVTLTDNDGVVIGALSGLTDEDGDAADDDLAVGASATATGTYTLTQSDIDAGSYENNVDADAVDPDGDPVTDDDTETVTLPKNAVIAVDKAAVDSDLDGLIWNDADLSGFPDAGETVDYDFTVTNDGNVTLFDVTLTDNDGVVIGALSGLTDEDGDAADDDLAVGASATATGTYTLTQSDIDAGSYENNVDADAVDPDGDPVTDDDTETVTLPKNAVIAVDKAAVDSDLDGLIWNDADLSGFPDAGETVDYDFTVTNDGNVTLFDVTLTDNDGVVIGALSGLTDEDDDAADDDLAVGASATATGTYTLTQSDIDAGSYENNVDADAVDPDGDPVTDDDTETVTLPKNAVIAVDKAAVDSDLDGLIWNDADLSGFPDAGETVDYDFTVTNDGNVTLFDVTLTDNDGVVIGALSGLTDEDGDAADDDLAVGASATATGTYTLTQSDIDAGSYENNVDADAVDPDGDPVTDDDTETVTLPKNAVIAVDKAAVDSDLDGLIWNDADLSGFPDAGETVDYDFTVTNDGNVTLFDVTLTDNDGVVIGALSGLTDEDGDAADDDLAVGASATATGTYTLTQSDIDAGSYENNVDADAVDPDGDPVTDDDTETVTLPKNAVIAVDKAAVDSDLDGLIWNDADLSGFPDAGETVDYDFTVTNDGNVTLFDVTLTDNDGVVIGALSGLTDEDDDAADDDLAVGASATATGTYTLTQSDIDAGSYENNVDADAVDPDGDPVTDDDTETVTLPQDPSIDVEKLVSVDGGLTFVDADAPPGPFVTEGSSVQFKFVVTNSGNVTLSGITLTDSDFNLSSCTITNPLSPNASFECIITTTAVPGQHTNTATADSDESAPDTDDANYFGMNGGQPSIQIKSLSISINASRTTVTGQFKITDESEGGNRPDGFLIALTDYGVRWEQKGASFAPVVPTGCTYTIVSVDYDQSPGWASGDDIIFDESVTIGYTCTFGSTQLTPRGTLRGTAYASIFGRDHVFTFSNTASIPR